nr:SDR family oxidoreductase [Sphingomonas sp. PAMC 26617]
MIVRNGSIAGFEAYPSQSLYHASKAAVRSVARSRTNDLTGRGIRVNVVLPGSADTPLVPNVFDGSPDAAGGAFSPYADRQRVRSGTGIAHGIFNRSKSIRLRAERWPARRRARRSRPLAVPPDCTRPAPGWPNPA